MDGVNLFSEHPDHLIRWFKSWDLLPADVIYSDTDVGEGVYQRVKAEALSLGGREFFEWVDGTIFAHSGGVHFISGSFKEWEDVLASFRERFCTAKSPDNLDRS